MKKLICLILCVLCLVPFMASCANPPEYAELDTRFQELVAASAEVNKIFFGEGLPTYERVYDPRSTTKTYKTTETDAEGNSEEKIYYYYELEDEAYGRVISYRSGFLGDYSYVRVVRTPETALTPVYSNDTTKHYAYALEGYEEPEYEFFYSDSDPTDYDYVRYDCEYTSIDQIKELAETVYSEGYLNSIYNSLFVGTTAEGSVSGLSARYIQYADDDGNYELMKSNTFEPLITETRVFDYSTAKITRNSSSKFVYIDIESYLPSAPNNRLTVTISMIYENGNWFLDSATY